MTQATQTLWEGEARSVSSSNAEGPFDILPMHANYITLINDDPIVVIEEDGAKKTYNFRHSVIYVHDNNVKIYADFT